MGLFQRIFKNDSIDFRGSNYGLIRNTASQRVIDNGDYDLLSNEYHKNGIARKLVAKPAEDATRNGWRLVINGNDEKQRIYQQALSALNLRQAFTQEIIYQRLYGDGYLTFGIDELNKTRTDIPLVIENIKSVEYINAFSPVNVIQTQVNNNPLSSEYGNESAVVVNITNQGEDVDKDGNITYKPLANEKVVIDKSRYFHISLDKMEDDNTGNSILVRCQDQIEALEASMRSTKKFLDTFNVRAYFSSQTLTLSPDAKRDLMGLFANALKTQGFLIAGDKDRFENISPNLSGLNDLFNHSWEQLTAVSEIPRSIMIGNQSGTLAGAGTDVQNYYMMVKTLQEEIIKPQLQEIVKMLMWSTNVGGASEDPETLDWKIEFNPLYSDDNKTQAETFQTYANALATLVNNGIISIDDAAQMLASQDNNAVHMMQSVKQDAADAPEFTKEELAKYKELLEHVENGKS